MDVLKQKTDGFFQKDTEFEGLADFFGSKSAYIVIVLGLVIVIAVGFSYYPLISTRSNRANRNSYMISKWQGRYEGEGAKRESLRSLLRTVSIPKSQRILTNFFVMTANCGAIFTPADGGLVSNDALSYQIRAGARAFIIDVYETIDTPNEPMVTALHPASKWKRVSMNSLTLRDVVNRLTTEALAGGPQPDRTQLRPLNDTDPLFIYLRFHKIHSRFFYDKVADILDNAIRNFRLDFTFNEARREKDLFMTDMVDLMGRVVILSNQLPTQTRLTEFINAGPVSGATQMFDRIGISSISSDRISQEVGIIQQHITLASDLLGTPDADKNGIGWRSAHNLGIHMVGMNFFSDEGDLEGYRRFFGPFSFAMKPEKQRFTVKEGPKPVRPSREVNTQGGTLQQPRFSLPA